MTDGLNIDALLGEQEDKTLTYKGQAFTLPAELPAATLAPFLSPKLGLIPLLQEALKDADDDANVIELVLNVIGDKQELPMALLAAGKDALRDLLGDDQYAAFMALKPSIPALALIARGLVTEYGMSLMAFFGSDGSSQSNSDGTDSKQTSPTTTQDSTPEGSGNDQAPTAS